MSILRKATPDDLERLWPMVEKSQSDGNPAASPAMRKAALASLLGAPQLGQIYLVGPTQAPVGYVALSYGFSILRGGKIAEIDQIFIRERVRGRGLGGQILSALPTALTAQGIACLSLSVSPEDHAAKRLFERAGFTPRSGQTLMQRRL